MGLSMRNLDFFQEEKGTSPLGFNIFNVYFSAGRDEEYNGIPFSLKFRELLIFTKSKRLVGYGKDILILHWNL